jgi:hypothetical protein
MRQTGAHLCFQKLLLILCCVVCRPWLPTFCSSFQTTALHLSACNGCVEACQRLIAGKADVNAKEQCVLLKFDFVLCRVFENRF